MVKILFGFSPSPQSVTRLQLLFMDLKLFLFCEEVEHGIIDESCGCQEEVVIKSLLVAKEFFKERSCFLRNVHIEKAGEKVKTPVS